MFYNMVDNMVDVLQEGMLYNIQSGKNIYILYGLYFFLHFKTIVI